MSIMTEDRLDPRDIKAFHKDVRSALLHIVNTYNVRYRSIRGTEILLYPPDGETRPFKVSAQRQPVDSLRFIQKFREEWFPDTDEVTPETLVSLAKAKNNPDEHPDLPDLPPIPEPDKPKAGVDGWQSYVRTRDKSIDPNIVYRYVDDVISIYCTACDTTISSPAAVGGHNRVKHPKPGAVGLHDPDVVAKRSGKGIRGGKRHAPSKRAAPAKKAEPEKVEPKKIEPQVEEQQVEQIQSTETDETADNRSVKVGDLLPLLDQIDSVIGRVNQSGRIDELEAQVEDLTTQVEAITTERDELRARLALIQEAMGV